MSNSAFNIRWSEVIIEALSRHKIKYFCISPGLRSTPLIIAVSNNKKIHCYTHFDERGLGYLALGISKASGCPVGVIVTSGTAVANLYPSLVESSLTGEKIVFLTADRPPELIGCGANQAIRQDYIFSSYPSKVLMLPRPTKDISAKWLVSSIDNCMNNLHHGSLHINCPFAEPLYDKVEGDYDWKLQLGNWWDCDRLWLTENFFDKQDFFVDWSFWQRKKGIIIVGRVNANDGREIVNWAKKLGWLIIGDVLSQTGQPYPYADLWLQHPEVKEFLKEVELIIQFGSSLTGKNLLNFRLNCNPLEYWIIDVLPQRLDPDNHRGKKFTCSIKNWLDNHIPCFTNLWCEKLLIILKKIQLYVNQRLEDNVFEIAIAHQLSKFLPKDGQLFIGNSLIIRLIDSFSQLPVGYPVYSNSGTKGIDGLISTIAGIQIATNKPTLGIIGDLSALHDLNGLALLRKPSSSVVLIIINNNGGQIFSMLKIPDELKRDYYCIPQNISFKHAAKMFGLEYCSTNNLLKVKSIIQKFWRIKNKSLLLELFVNTNDTKIMLNKLIKEIINL